MGKVQFEVSAKTARLIGRENISDVDGAIVELIKNSYDADATCVFVLFNMPFPAVPKTITYETVNNVFGIIVTAFWSIMRMMVRDLINVQI